MIRLDRVSFTYPGASLPALCDASLTIARGELAVVAGPSGGGKSTLLRALNGLVPHFTGGRLRGSVAVDGRSPTLLGPSAMAGVVGFVAQDPEAQHVLEVVEDEVAFALENRAVPADEMRRRVPGALELVGLLPRRERPVETLSGGEKQLLAIACALTLGPRVLVLDEPTSQLAPEAAADVLAAIARLRTAPGMTVVLAEHRLERVLHLADRLVYVDGGRVISGPPRDLAAHIELVPPLVRLGRVRGWRPLPLTVAEAQRFAHQTPGAAAVELSTVEATPSGHATQVDSQPRDGAALASAGAATSDRVADRSILVVRDLAYQHRTTGCGIRAVDLDLAPGEVVALMGPNGSGKTTLLRCLVGLLRPRQGTIELSGRSLVGQPTAAICRQVGYLPQLPDDLLFAETVGEELAITLRNHDLFARPPIAPERLLARLGLATLADRYPRDLSAGERQRVALAAIAVTQPRVLLLDEPTRGMDYRAKRELILLLRGWREDGLAILLVTHDAELAAEVADRVVRLVDGRVVASGLPAELLVTQVGQLYPGTGWLSPRDVPTLTGASEPAPMNA